MAKNIMIDMANAYGVTLAEVFTLKRTHGKATLAKHALAYTLYEYECLRPADIGRHFNVSGNQINHIVRKVRDLSKRPEYAPMHKVIDLHYGSMIKRCDMINDWQIRQRRQFGAS